MFSFLFLPITQSIASKNDFQAEDSVFLVGQGDLEIQESSLRASDFQSRNEHGVFELLSVDVEYLNCICTCNQQKVLAKDKTEHRV